MITNQTIKKMQRKVKPVISGGAYFAMRFAMKLPVDKATPGAGSFAALSLRKLFGYVTHLNF